MKPLANFNYDSTTSYMYRGYNGAMYGPGKALGKKAKVRYVCGVCVGCVYIQGAVCVPGVCASTGGAVC